MCGDGVVWSGVGPGAGVETLKKAEVQGNRLQSIDITGYWVFNCF